MMTLTIDFYLNSFKRFSLSGLFKCLHHYFCYPILITMISIILSRPIFSQMVVESFNYPHFYIDQNITEKLKIPNIFVIVDLDEEFELSEVEGRTVVGDALFYPNPFRISEGSDLGYYLSKSMDIEIRLYNMRAQEVYKQTFNAGSNGGLGKDFGYNRVAINSSHFNYNLSSGVYIFLIINDEKVLHKGKFFILP